MYSIRTSRREFITRSLVTGVGLAAGLRTINFGGIALADPAPMQANSQVALTNGIDHVDNVFRALQQLKPQIAAAIGNRPVLIKPNNVGGGRTPLADTPRECIEAILEFLKSIGKTDVTVAECTLTTAALKAFENMDYLSLAKKHPVRFKGLSEEGYQTMTVYNEGSLLPNPKDTPSTGNKYKTKVRVSKMLLNPNYFIISACRIKTHDRVVATLSLKNIVMGSIIDDSSYFINTANGVMDKQFMHGNSDTRSSVFGGTQQYQSQDLSNTLCMLSRVLAPDLSVIDAYQGMQGQGPTGGLPVDPQKAAIASLDFLSADRVGVELMNCAVGIQACIDAGKCEGNDSGFAGWNKYPAYLNYCAQQGVGQYDLSKINFLGDVTGTGLAALPANSPLRTTYGLSSNTTNGSVLNINASPASSPMLPDRRGWV